MLILLGLGIFAVACRTTEAPVPSGFLGLEWGDDAQEGARRLGLAISRWQPWVDPTFETGIDLDQPQVVLGLQGFVSLVRARGGQLDGIQVRYLGCANDDALRQRLREGLRQKKAGQLNDVDMPYQTWGDGSLIHLSRDSRDGTCTLTVAGPRFGKAFQAMLLREGLGKLGAGIGPR